ncbi:DUF2189 domain-containing protein [Rhodovibrionaceae bacterium A322]
MAGQTTTEQPVMNQMPKIKSITVDQPWVWLAKGWQDLRAAPGVSLGYGAIFAIFGLIITTLTYTQGNLAWILPLSGGFLLLAPVLAVGLYEVSRHIARGENVTMGTALVAWQHNLSQVSFMGVVLLLFWIAWARLAFLIFALFFSDQYVTLDNFFEEVFLNPENWAFLVTGTAIGAVLAILVFSVAAVSIPMLIDRDVNVVVAIATSIKTVHQNFFPMVVWASLIALFTIAGFFTFYLGLIITMPLIAHATWHAYEDLVNGVE